MKKWFFLLVLLLIVSYGYTRFLPADTNGQLPEIDYQMQEEILQENDKAVPVTIEDIYKGNLVLINEEYPVSPSGAESEAITLSDHWESVNGFVLLDHNIRLAPSLLRSFSTMIEAASHDGVNHFMLTSGYRDTLEQGELYEELGPEYALPAGHSEHNLGLALDIGSTQGEMAHAAEGKWLKENAWKYGFILRYPEDKTHITGIQYEPWHFRYVGLPHSAIMYEKNFVLEEYLDFVKEQKSIVITLDEQVYEISYHPISQSTTIQVSANDSYEISGNNMDGVIMTVHTSNQDETQSNAARSEGNGV